MAAESTLTESELRVSDAIGQLMEFWGFKRNMGRLWTVLYLAAEPMTAKELKDRLGLSVGAVSMTINDLLRWGVVKKVWVQGQRADHFVAEDQIWKMVSRVLAERERVEVDKLIDTLEAALAAFSRAERSQEGAERTRAKRARVRVSRLLELAKIGRSVLDALIEKARVDMAPVVRFLLGEESSP
jgi:DNA-binding transcriptional regulator GbsR (MarR family)